MSSGQFPVCALWPCISWVQNGLHLHAGENGTNIEVLITGNGLVTNDMFADLTLLPGIKTNGKLQKNILHIGLDISVNQPSRELGDQRRLEYFRTSNATIPAGRQPKSHSWCQEESPRIRGQSASQMSRPPGHELQPPWQGGQQLQWLPHQSPWRDTAVTHKTLGHEQLTLAWRVPGQSLQRCYVISGASASLVEETVTLSNLDYWPAMIMFTLFLGLQEFLHFTLTAILHPILMRSQ